MEKEIQIEGTILTDKYSEDEISEMFIKWVEDEGLKFCGIIRDCSDETISGIGE